MDAGVQLRDAGASGGPVAARRSMSLSGIDRSRESVVTPIFGIDMANRSGMSAASLVGEPEALPRPRAVCAAGEHREDGTDDTVHPMEGEIPSGRPCHRVPPSQGLVRSAVPDVAIRCPGFRAAINVSDVTIGLMGPWLISHAR